MSLSIENLDEDLSNEEENFSTEQLFLFAWQIAKGMVTNLFFLDNVDLILILSITWKEKFKSQNFISMK